MRALSTDAANALAAGQLALATLVLLEFPSLTIALNSSNMDLEHGGHTFLGAHGLGTITPIEDRPGDLPGVQLQLMQVDSSFIALALDDADQVQGSPITIMTAILDADTWQVVAVETDWAGYADKMTIVEDGEQAIITLSAESKAVDLLRGQSLLYSDSDQRSLYPADRALEYMASQAAAPVVWPNRQWLFK